MIPLPTVEQSGPPRVVAFLDVLFVLLLFLLLVGDLGRRQPPIRSPRSRFMNECLHGRPRMEITVHHGPEDECGRYRRGQRCEDVAHWHLNVGGVPVADAPELAHVLNDPHRHVRLRADAGAPYGVVQEALAACVEAGMQGVELSAFRQR